LLFLLSAAAARAEDPADLPAADRSAIHDVIQHQIDAFQHDDASGAFAFASPSIQAEFGDASRFLRMVQTGYPPVYRPRSVTFGALVEDDGRLEQKVELIGPDGHGVLALYFMEKEPDGTWRIDGCVLTESEAVGA
jgi:hypothetical protein